MQRRQYYGAGRLAAYQSMAVSGRNSRGREVVSNGHAEIEVRERGGGHRARAFGSAVLRNVC